MIKNLKTNLGIIYVFKLITKNERGKKNLISRHECLMHRTRTNMYYKHETCLINVVSHFPSIFSASKQKKTKESSFLITREITKELIPIVSTKMENRNGNGDARAYFL